MAPYSLVASFVTTLLVLAVFTEVLYFAIASSCNYSSLSCKLTLTEDDGSHKVIDMSSYTSLLEYYDETDDKFYNFKPCGAITRDDSNNCIGTKGCQIYQEVDSYGYHYYPMGTNNDPVCAYTSGEGPNVTFAGSMTYYGFKRSMQITFLCDDMKKQLEFVYNDTFYPNFGETTYQFTVTGANACPKKQKGEDDDGMSAWLLVGIGAGIVYGIVGVASRLLFVYQFFSRKNAE